MSNKTNITVSFPFAAVLFCIFLVLKLTHYIDWSWWWVTAPLWIPYGICFFFILLIIIAKIIFVRDQMHIDSLSPEELTLLDLSLEQSWALCVASIRVARGQHQFERIKEIKNQCKLIKKIRNHLAEIGVVKSHNCRS